MVAFHDLRAIGLSDDFSVPNGLDHGDYPTFHRILLYAQSNLVLPPSEIKSELELAPRECADCVNRPWYRCILVPGQVVLAPFQLHAGLQESGEVDEATLKALNVPADVRAHEFESSAKRIADIKIQFDQPSVVVNIPTALRTCLTGWFGTSMRSSLTLESRQHSSYRTTGEPRWHFIWQPVGQSLSVGLLLWSSSGHCLPGRIFLRLDAKPSRSSGRPEWAKR
jgi:hypothetical protein